MMSRRMKAVETLAKFFAEQGGIPTAKEYNKMPGRPFNITVVRRIVGPWSRVISWVHKYYPELAAQAEAGQEIFDEAATAAEQAAAEQAAKEAAEEAAKVAAEEAAKLAAAKEAIKAANQKEAADEE